MATHSIRIGGTARADRGARRSVGRPSVREVCLMGEVGSGHRTRGMTLHRAGRSYRVERIDGPNGPDARCYVHLSADGPGPF